MGSSESHPQHGALISFLLTWESAACKVLDIQCSLLLSKHSLWSLSWLLLLHRNVQIMPLLGKEKNRVVLFLLGR